MKHIVVVGDKHKIEYFRSKLLPLNNKAAKLGLPLISFKRSGKIIKSKYDSQEHRHVQYEELVYVLSGTVPRLNDYEYLGKIEHVFKEGNIIHSLVDGVNLESYRHAKAICVHCGKPRSRKESHLLQKDGEILQVGSSCLADFLREDTYLDYLESFYGLVRAAGEEDGLRGFRFKQEIHVPTFFEDVLRYTLSANQTVDTRFKDLLLDYLRFQFGLLKFNRGEEALKAKFLEKCAIFERPVSDDELSVFRHNVLQYLEAGGNNFVNNLRIMSKEEFLPLKRMSMAIWMVLSYKKSLTWQADKELREKERIARLLKLGESNRYLGAVGDLMNLQLIVKERHIYEGQYGSILYLLMHTEEGVTVEFKGTATDMWDLQEGSKYQMEAKVKEHVEGKTGRLRTRIWKTKNIKEVKDVAN